MSIKKVQQKAEARRRQIQERYRNHPTLKRCPACSALVPRDILICWKCGGKLCE